MNPLGLGTKLAMQMQRLLVLVALLATVVLVACGGDDDDPATAAGETTTAEGTAGDAQGGASSGAGGGTQQQPQQDQQGGGGDNAGGSGTEIVTADSQFGPVLFGPDERAIYYFDKETSSESECYGACAEAWPPVITEGEPQAGEGIEAGLLGTTERDDGSTQVTYAGRPLYYYVDDPAGEVLCHNVEEFGGLWLAVQPNGDPVP
jgi:predicted lipoprotein with Yx(FWY)xxD motif